MDYFKERRAYRNFKMYEKRVSQAQNDLYRELLDYANDQGVLDKPFHLMNDALLKLTGLNETTMFNARNKLVQFGLIKYEKGKRNLDTPIYQIIKLYENWGRTNNKSGDDTGVTFVDDTRATFVDEPGITTGDDTGGNLLTNTRQDITITQHNKPEDGGDLPIQKIAIYYQQNIGAIKPLVMEDLRSYLDDLKKQGTPEDEAVEIIKFAIKIAVDNNKLSWGYANAVLKNWTSSGLFTMANIKAVREEHKAKMQIKTSNYGRQPKQEVATDYSKHQAKAVDPAELAELQKQWREFKKQGSAEP